jgi:MYXO-CTERM domain-containing protein
MTSPRRHSLWLRVRLPAAAALLLVSTAGRASVTEPNGTVVPVAMPSPGYTEETLQTFFTAQGETINALNDASIDPAVFLPLCDFQATLVLSQSGAQAGFGWYNVPASPTAAPTWYQIGTTNFTLGQSISSAAIRSDPNYMGGLIGFALLKNFGSGFTPIYYSESMRNVDCTGCSMPGYWKMMLSYQSTKTANAYYLAWEDWEGANATSWPDDGDFNDKVFYVTGVTCNGGGQTCDTGKLGVCAAGMTDCDTGTSIICRQQIQPSMEVCNNLDDDCNGQVDDGATCPTQGFICVQGKCVKPCDNSEFSCATGQQCDQGLCVDPKCVGITCDVGTICIGGNCVGGCGGVTCPLGQTCRLGLCVDPCAGVTCNGSVCENGACVESCNCRICGTGQTCASSGHCVDDGCDTLTCPAGQVCQLGACVDACTGAVCPGGAGCHNGVCDPPSTVTPTGAAGSSGAAGNSGAGGSGAGGSGSVLIGNAGTTGTGTGTAGSGLLGSGGNGAGGTSGPAKVGGCSCAVGRTGPAAVGGMLLPLAAALLGLLRARRPRRRR